MCQTKKLVHRLVIGVVGSVGVTVLPLLQTSAATVEIFPLNGNAPCSKELETAANTLKPGDSLILHAGIYTQTCRRAIMVNGTATNPVTIRAADGENPIITRPRPANFSYNQNNIEIVNSSF